MLYVAQFSAYFNDLSQELRIGDMFIGLVLTVQRIPIDSEVCSLSRSALVGLNVKVIGPCST